MTASLHVAMFATALGCGLMAGVWFAFSAFVMDGLGRLEPADGILAMQSINRRAVTPVFMTALFGTAALCLALALWAALSWGDRRAAWVLAGAALYLLGTIGVTIGANVPLNDGLAALGPDAGGAARDWERYLTSWTAWNHVRAASSLAAAALLTVALTEG